MAVDHEDDQASWQPPIAARPAALIPAPAPAPAASIPAPGPGPATPSRIRLTIDELVAVVTLAPAPGQAAMSGAAAWPDSLLTEDGFEPDGPALRLQLRALQVDHVQSAAGLDLHAHALSALVTETLWDTGAVPTPAGALPGPATLITVPVLSFRAELPSTAVEAPTSDELKARMHEWAERTSARSGLALVGGHVDAARRSGTPKASADLDAREAPNSGVKRTGGGSGRTDSLEAAFSVHYTAGPDEGGRAGPQQQLEVKLRPALVTLDLRLLDHLQHYLLRPSRRAANDEDSDDETDVPASRPRAPATPPAPSTTTTTTTTTTESASLPIRVSAPLVRLHVVAPRTLAVPEYPDWQPSPGTVPTLPPTQLCTCPGSPPFGSDAFRTQGRCSIRNRSWWT